MPTLEDQYGAVTVNPQMMRQLRGAAARQNVPEGEYAPLHYLAEGFMGGDEGPSGSVMDPNRARSRTAYDIGRALSIVGDAGPAAGVKGIVAAAPLLAKPMRAAAKALAKEEAKLAVEAALPPSFVRKPPPPGFDPAARYPVTGEPLLTKDPKTGKEYYAKTSSAESEWVKEVREAAQKEIDSGNWTPLFDPAKRFHVDASKYPAQVKTTEVTLPKKQETIDKYKALADTPEARMRLAQAFHKGSSDPGAIDWYAMGQLEEAYVKEHGEVVGRELFKERFADAMAATTGGADPTANKLMADYANFTTKTQGVPLPPTNRVPYPIGGRYAGGNLEMYDKVIGQGAGLDPIGQPKRYNFSGNFTGNRAAATIDEQMMGGFDPTGKTPAPPGLSYGVYEDVVHQLARGEGVYPQNFQDVAWAGLKRMKAEEAAAAKGKDYVHTPAKPMISHVNESIYRTSRVTGLPQEEVLRRHVRGEIPMYSAAPLGLGTYYGMQEENSEAPNMGDKR